jgi:hypothetical protein
MVGTNTFRSAATLAAVLLMLSVSCGGDNGVTTPVVPPRVVTTIDVSPSTSALLVGDTLTLTATARDQQGASMPGVVVAWSTSNAGVATVSSAGKVTTLAAGSVVISASAEGKTGSASLTIAVPKPTAALEPANVTSASIGPAGGTITTTSSAGIQYTLEIPAGALISAQQITMTPITDITHLGLSGGLAGAVDLQPSGLVFAEPARLRIRSSRTAPNGMRLVGFTANADFSQRELAVTASAISEVVVLLSHFSFTGAGFGTTFEVSQFPVMPNQTIEAMLSQAIALSPLPWDAAATAQASQLAQQAFDQIVLPGLSGAATDAALLDAISDYGRWRLLLAIIVNGGFMPIAVIGSGASILDLPIAFVDEALAGVNEAADGIQLAISANSDVCGSQASIEALRNVYFWHNWAGRLSVADAQHGLDLPTVVAQIRSKCAVVVLKDSNLPDSLPGGQNFNLELDFALRFKNGVEQPTDFRIDLVGSGVNVTNPGGFTGIGNTISPVGFYTTVINPTSAGGFRLKAKSCFVPSRTDPVVTTLCDEFELTKVVYFNDFEGTVGAEWSIAGTATTPSGRRFLGVLSNVTDDLTVDSIPLHTELILEFDLFIIGSWNGNAEDPSAGQPDIIEVSVLGGGSLKKTTFSNKPRDRQAFPGDFPGSSFPFASGAAEQGTLGFPGGSDFIGDAVYRIRLQFPHTASSIRLLFNANHNGSIEKWGLDNVRLKTGS